jgi:hypothetical protein
LLPDPIVCGAGLREGEAEVVAGVRGVEEGAEEVVATCPRGRADNGFCGGADGGLAATAQQVREDDRGQNRGVWTPTIGSYRVVEIMLGTPNISCRDNPLAP